MSKRQAPSFATLADSGVVAFGTVIDHNCKKIAFLVERDETDSKRMVCSLDPHMAGQWNRMGSGSTKDDAKAAALKAWAQFDGVTA